MSLPVMPEALPLEYAFGMPEINGRFRVSPEDFCVDEVLGIEPDGAGEHLLMHIRKRGQNTDWVARQLASFASVRPMDVSYSGMKDRHAVTSQWFSVHLPLNKPQPCWDALELDGVEVLSMHRHGRKLRSGTHRANRFQLLIRDVEGAREAWESRLAQIASRGVPNYFGEQRFGRDDSNIRQAWAMLAGGVQVRDRHKRGIYLSAARSLLFNQYLTRRIASDCWDRPVPGDAMMLDGSRSFFVIDDITDEVMERLARWDIHPAGPMWGKGESTARGLAIAFESAISENFAPWCEGLIRAGLDFERRPLRLHVGAMAWLWTEYGLELNFELGRGSFATSVLRELMGTE